ncbi:MAG: hypothetical protein AB1750_00820 [Chloroflexota bacterium]
MKKPVNATIRILAGLFVVIVVLATQSQVASAQSGLATDRPAQILAAPGAFGKTSPVNASVDEPTSLTLSWGASAGATDYEYCYDTSNDNDCTGWTSTGTNTSVGISGLSTNTTYYWQVRANDGSGTTYADGDLTVFWSFTTLPDPPAAFGKSSPADTATGLSTSPNLSWGASAGAASYEYCYDTSNDNACSGWTDNGASTNVTLGGLSGSTTYYWHVRAVNAGGTVYSDGADTAFWSFTTAAVAPGAFGKSTPANGAVNQSLAPTLSWGASAGVTSYEYCYDTSNDNACSSWTDVGTATSVGLGGLSTNTTYYWHVRANNAGGTIYSDGADTAFWSFTTVPDAPGALDKVSPANGAINQPTSFTISWSASAGAVSYEYCYDKTNDNACTNWKTAGAATSKTISGLTRSSTYYWQVRAVNPGGVTYADGGTYWSFTTVPPAPGSFSKVSPANGAVNQPLALTLTWNSSNNADYYEYCIDTTNDNACTPWINVGLSTSVAIGGLNNATTYYWHVRATNIGGTTYSNGVNADWPFTTVPFPPAAFGRIGPANGAINVSTSPTLSWGASAGVTTFEYCYDTTNDNACSNWTGNGTSTSAALSGLATSTTYYWHVRAVNAGGTAYADGSATAFWSFTTVPPAPGAFGKISPVNGAINRPTTLTLSWGAASGAVAYEYCYDTTNDNACSGWANNGLATSVTLNGLAMDAVYYWQARAVNIGGPTYADGGTYWSFATVLSSAILISPPDGEQLFDRRPFFDWADIEGASGYTIEVSAVPTFASKVLSRVVTPSYYQTTADLMGGRTYYWRVKPKFGRVWGPYSEVYSFTTGNPPSTPTLLLPENNALLSGASVIFDWSNSTVPAGETFDYYQFQIATDLNFNNLVYENFIYDISASFDKVLLTTGAGYQWRVRAVGANGHYSAWATRAVRIKYSPPEALTPFNGETVASLKPTFSWTVPFGVGITNYTFQVSKVMSFSSYVVNANIAATSYTAGKNLAPATTYYWRVRVNGLFGPSNWSIVFSFTTP